MLGGNRVERIEAESVEFIEVVAPPSRIELVHREENRFADLAQRVHDLTIQRIEPVFTVEKKQYDVGLFHGAPALFLHALTEIVAGFGIEAAGVDEQISASRPFGFGVISVPSHAG